MAKIGKNTREKHFWASLWWIRVIWMEARKEKSKRFQTRKHMSKMHETKFLIDKNMNKIYLKKKTCERKNFKGTIKKLFTWTFFRVSRTSLRSRRLQRPSQRKRKVCKGQKEGGKGQVDDGFGGGRGRNVWPVGGRPRRRSGRLVLRTTTHAKWTQNGRKTGAETHNRFIAR